MPSVPKTQVMKSSVCNMDILNVIRANAPATYQDRVPVATQETLKDVYKILSDNNPLANDFINALVNRIARVIITSKSYQNQLRSFKKGMLEYGEIIEEVFVNIAKAHPFDPAVAETDVFKREIPDVNAVFHRMNYQNFYKVTISNDQLRQAFLSSYGISDLIARIVDTLYSGAEYDEFLIMKNLIAQAANEGRMYPVNVPAATAENAKAIVTAFKQVSNQLEFMSSTYNAMGVLNRTPKNDQYLLIDAAFDAIMDVEVLASAFNMEKAEFLGHRVLVDNFGKLTGVVAALVDKDWFMVFDNFVSFTENYNGEGLYWNYFYHVWKTFSVSPFANAILFTTEAIGVTSVDVNPATASVSKGQTAKFSATVTGTGYVPQNVKWSVTGTSTPTSTISWDGVLTVAANEPNTTLTVTATSLYDGQKSDTATVTVV